MKKDKISDKGLTRAQKDENDRDFRTKTKLDIMLMTRFGMLDEYLAKLNKLERKERLNRSINVVA